MKKFKIIGIIFGSFVGLIFLLLCFIYALSSIVSISGKSMEPTYQDGDKVFTEVYSEPEIGDVIVFDCLSKCSRNGDDRILVKRLTNIDENGCYWVRGDNTDDSFDSRNFGYLCGDDIQNLKSVWFKL